MPQKGQSEHLEVVVTYFITHAGYNDLHGRFDLVYDPERSKVKVTFSVGWA